VLYALLWCHSFYFLGGRKMKQFEELDKRPVFEAEASITNFISIKSEIKKNLKKEGINYEI